MVFLVLVASLRAAGGAHVTKEPVAEDGTPVQIDLPKSLHLRNKGGSDSPRGPGYGSGLCVFTSLNHSAYWQNIWILQDFRDWMTHFPGGGYPAKVDSMIARLCKDRHAAKPKYLQSETNNLDILRLAIKTGRMPCITYYHSPTGRYGGSRISHMVNLVSAGTGKGPDGKGWWTVLDNNYPGSYEWMSEAEFLRTASGGNKIWSVIFLSPTPPPVPVN